MSNAIVPAMTIEQSVDRYNALVEFTKRVMKDGKDYGIVPGTDKPTLLKPGAEKLCTLFGLSPEFEIADKIVDFKGGLFYFQYRCKLVRDGQVVATGLGSCNSMEKKYRYRNVPEKKATQEEKDTALRVETKSGRYGDYRVYVIENKEPFDLINTLDKMAQKRSLVAAILIGANASEFYTQDVEDMGYLDGEYREVTPPQPVKREVKQAAPKRAPAPEPEPVEVPDSDFLPMPLEEAKLETDSKGEYYWNIPSEDLSNKTIGISRAINKNNLTPEKRAEYQRKLDAIGTILKYRAEQDAA